MRLKTVKMIYTFGVGQKHRGKYVVIKGKDREDCRDKMIAKHGMEWAYVYEFSKLADLERIGLKELRGTR